MSHSNPKNIHNIPKHYSYFTQPNTRTEVPINSTSAGVHATTHSGHSMTRKKPSGASSSSSASRSARVVEVQQAPRQGPSPATASGYSFRKQEQEYRAANRADPDAGRRRQDRERTAAGSGDGSGPPPASAGRTGASSTGATPAHRRGESAEQQQRSSDHGGTGSRRSVRSMAVRPKENRQPRMDAPDVREESGTSRPSNKPQPSSAKRRSWGAVNVSSVFSSATDKPQSSKSPDSKDSKYAWSPEQEQPPLATPPNAPIYGQDDRHTPVRHDSRLRGADNGFVTPERISGSPSSHTDTGLSRSTAHAASPSDSEDTARSLSVKELEAEITFLRNQLEQAYEQEDEEMASTISVQIVKLRRRMKTADQGMQHTRDVSDHLLKEVEYAKKQMVARKESVIMLTAKLEFFFKNGLTMKTCDLLRAELEQEIKLISAEVEQLRQIRIPSDIGKTAEALEAVRNDTIQITIRDFLEPLEVCRIYLQNIGEFKEFILSGGLLPTTPIYWNGGD